MLRFYDDKRRQYAARPTSSVDAEGEELQAVNGKRTVSSRKRRRASDRISSKLANEHSGLEAANSLLDPDKQPTVEQGSLTATMKDDDDQSQRNSERLSEEDKGVYSFKRALSRLNPARQKKFFWSEEAER